MSNPVEGAVATTSTQLSLVELKTLAVQGLVRMFNQNNQLFCFRLRQTDHGLVQEGVSPRYTIISVMELHRLEAFGYRSPINVKALLRELLRKPNWIDSGGDLRLLLWLCSLVTSKFLRRICSSPGLKMALTVFRDTRDRRTMELAWLLTGLVHAVSACPEVRADFADLTAQTYELLRENQGERGLIRHVGRKRTIAGLTRSRIGSLADQVYPIYASARLSEAFESDGPLAPALRYEEAICKRLGPLGQ